MLNYAKLCLLVIVSVAVSSSTQSKKNVICYYEGWTYRHFTPDMINATICTHINFAFLGIQPNGSIRWLQKESVFKAVARLKHKHPNLKLLVSVGGWNQGSANFSIVAGDVQLTRTFSMEVKIFLDKYNYDGVDIDWEYPGERGGNAADRAGFVNLLRTLKQTIGEGRLVTTAVSSNPKAGEYDVPSISQVVDFVNVMTYNFHSGSRTVGQNAPLLPHPNDTEMDKSRRNVASAVSNWIIQGTDPRKLILGIHFYGHAYKLADPNDYYIGAKTTGSGSNGGSYQKICNSTNKFTRNKWNYVYDEIRRVPYMYNKEEVVVYDNEQSIKEKILYANIMDLGGVMMWAVDKDAIGGACGYMPLLNTIERYINL